MAHTRSIFSVALLTAFLAACGGSESPTGPSDNGDGNGSGGDTRTIKANPSFSADIQEILTRKGCTAGNCHGAGSGGLTLGSNASTNHNTLTSTNSTTGERYVIANDANNSYIVKKVEGRGAGARMPSTGTPLDNIDLTNLKNWINTGAPNN